MATANPWHAVPGRLQAVSVASRSQLWGITLDYQLCKLNSETRKWQLVSVLPEAVNSSRYSSSTSASASATSPRPSSLGQSRMRDQFGRAQQHHEQQGPRIDPDYETTIQVAVGSDGTVVRLDQTLRAWFLIAPNGTIDFEKDVIWIDLEHFWKCVSVASVSQIWGLTETGDIYYGTSDRFIELDSVVSGNERPQFTHISAGHDNVVIATDGYSGTAFRLFTDVSSPIWRALPGTGSRAGLHLIQCCISNIDYIVGLDEHGRVLQFVDNQWRALEEGGDGSGVRTFVNVDVGDDGYVVAVDKDGDLHGCQLEVHLDSIAPIFSRIQSKATSTTMTAADGGERPRAQEVLSTTTSSLIDIPTSRKRASSTSYQRRMDALPTPSIMTSRSKLSRERGSYNSGYGDGTAATAPVAVAATASSGSSGLQPNLVTASPSHSLSTPKEAAAAVPHIRPKRSARELFEGGSTTTTTTTNTAKHAITTPSTPSTPGGATTPTLQSNRNSAASSTNNINNSGNIMSSPLVASFPHSTGFTRTASQSSQASYANDFGQSYRPTGASTAALVAATSAIASARSASPSSPALTGTLAMTNASPLRIKTKLDALRDSGSFGTGEEPSRSTQRRSDNSEGMSSFSPTGYFSPGLYSSDDLATPSPFPGQEEVLPTHHQQSSQQQRDQHPLMAQQPYQASSPSTASPSMAAVAKSIQKSPVDLPVSGNPYANPYSMWSSHGRRHAHDNSSDSVREKVEVDSGSIAQESKIVPLPPASGHTAQQDPYIQTYRAILPPSPSIDTTMGRSSAQTFGTDGGWGGKEDYNMEVLPDRHQSQHSPWSQSPSSPSEKQHGWGHQPSGPGSSRPHPDKTEWHGMGPKEESQSSWQRQARQHQAQQYPAQNHYYQDQGDDNTLLEPPPSLFRTDQHRLSSASSAATDQWLDEQQEYLKLTSLRTRDSAHSPAPIRSDFVPTQVPVSPYNPFQQQYNPSTPSPEPHAESQMQPVQSPSQQQQQQQQQTQHQQPTPMRPYAFKADDEPGHMGRPSYSSSHLQHYLDTTLKNEYPPSPLSPSSGRRIGGAGTPSPRPSSPATPINAYGSWGRTGTTVTRGASSLTSRTVSGGGGGGATGTMRTTPPTTRTATPASTAKRTGSSALAPTSPRPQSGIQGEDEQGRWIERPTEQNPRVAQWDPDHNKSKCCTIL